MRDDAHDAIARMASAPIDHAEKMRQTVQRWRTNTAEIVRDMLKEGEITEATTVSELLVVLNPE